MTPEDFGVTSDSDVPLCLAYNGYHFESMLPINQSDVEKTKDLVQQVSDGTYNYKKEDISRLIAPYSSSERTIRSRQTNPDLYSRDKIKKTNQRREARLADPKAYSEEKIKITNQQKEARLADPEAYSEAKIKITKEQKEARLRDPEAYSLVKKKIVQQREKNKNIAFQSNLERDTGFDSICCICRELKSKDKTTNITNIPLELVTEFCHKDNATLCSDGTHKACKECQDMLKKKKTRKQLRQRTFWELEFPKNFD